MTRLYRFWSALAVLRSLTSSTCLAQSSGYFELSSFKSDASNFTDAATGCDCLCSS